MPKRRKGHRFHGFWPLWKRSKNGCENDPQKWPQIVAFIRGFSIGAKMTGFSQRMRNFAISHFLVISGENRTFCAKCKNHTFRAPAGLKTLCKTENILKFCFLHNLCIISTFYAKKLFFFAGIHVFRLKSWMLTEPMVYWSFWGPIR